MIAVISPAKRLNEDPLERSLPTTTPALLSDIEELLEVVKSLTKDEIQALMKTSDNLTDLTYERFQNFEMPFSRENSKPAAFLLDGDTYRGLEASSLSDEDLDYAQDHVRILSGLYGILRPLDLIQPYRLEMGRSLRTSRGDDLYQFWGTTLTDVLHEVMQDHADKTIVRVASNEYFSAIDTDQLDGNIIDCTFREQRDGELKFISFYAKKARGMLARYLVKHRVEDREGIKTFSDGNYLFREDLSSDEEFVFVRPDSRG